MATLPHDITDLNLAPIALAIDERIEELGRLNASDLAFAVALKGDQPHWSATTRSGGLVDAIGRSVELHDWALSIDPRGLRLRHRQNTLVLGLPATLWAYISGS